MNLSKNVKILKIFNIFFVKINRLQCIYTKNISLRIITKKKNLKLKAFCNKKIRIILLNEKNILRRKIRENHSKILKIFNKNFENFVKKSEKN